MIGDRQSKIIDSSNIDIEISGIAIDHRRPSMIDGTQHAAPRPWRISN